MLKSAMALITILLSLNPAIADTVYFIQITATPPAKTFVDDGDTPGGVEIFKGDKFVACALAFTIDSWNGGVLAPFSYGFMSKYSLKELTFKPRGALTRIELIKKETKVQE